MVSVEPIIVDVTLPIKESAPYCFNMSETKASDALPEMGRIKTRGSVSDGMLKSPAIGFAA